MMPQASSGEPDSGPPNSQLRWSLLVPHRERLVRIARRRLPSLADAEDCVHEALVRAAAFPTLDATRTGAFLTSTVLRLCVDHHRSRQRGERAMQRCVGAAVAASPEESICDEAEATWLLGMLVTLRGRERQVLAARAAGRSTRQAAADLSISVKAAEGAFTRGRARLVELCRA